MAKEKASSWVGIMFDGGLCIAGKPNPPAINLVKSLLKKGTAVKVVASRILLQGEDDGKGGTRDPEGHIKQWCKRRFGKELPITTEIDLGMTALHGTKCHPIRVRKPATKKAANN